MNDLQKVLDRVFNLLSTIPVYGDGVELMASARENLRRAYRMAGQEQEDGADG